MGTLESSPVKFKVTTFCTRLCSLPDGGQSVSLPPPRSTPPHSAPLDPLAPRDASSPVPPTVLSVASSALDSESVNAFVTGSDASAASALSHATFQSISVGSHHCLATRAPVCRLAFLHRPSIDRAAINCAALFCLRRIDV